MRRADSCTGLSGSAANAVALALALLLSCTAWPAATPTPAEPRVPTISAAAFLDSLAVNTHINYRDGAYANVRNVADDLAWLGVHHIREGTPDGSAPFESYVYLAQHGVRFDYVIRPNVAESLQQLDAFNAAAPGSVAAVEGFNEIDNFPVQYDGLKGDAAGLGAQRTIYRHVKGDPALAGVAVYDLTGYDIKPVATRAEAADHANAHMYPQNGEQPGYNANGDHWLAWATDGRKKFGLPIVITEFGYFSIPQAGWYMLGVDEPTQAKGVLNGYFDAAAAGVVRTYVYELLDEKPDPQSKNGEMHFGLFRNDNSPKPVATAIHNLTSILSAPLARARDSSTRGMPAVTLAGLPVSGNSLLLQKADGRVVLALWNEVPIWNRATGTPVSHPPARVEVDFGETASEIALYDPTVSSEPLARRSNTRRFVVDVPDHPVLIEVTSAAAEHS
ncbi:calcium-binding protein [Paraburkholderia sp. B3]|uniref:calcium-binding protein n=1 Tax=Paraburkholderia sp. B3 TaxID=3134791 RepID=UPI0039824A72